MAVNKAFHTSNSTAIQTEKNLYSDLVKEAIQIYGHDVYYIDRTTVAIDNILGEDSLSKFTTQVPIEMYVENAEGGYQGEKELMSQFGLENRNELTLVVHRERFQDLTKQIQIESGTDTTGGAILLESGTIDQSSDSSVLETVTSGSDFYLLTETDGDNIIGEDDSTSVGESILLENDADSGDSAYLLTEDYIVGDAVQDKTAQNELFDKLDNSVLDFSESNPFGDAGVSA